jgi:hypothetical protein
MPEQREGEAVVVLHIVRPGDLAGEHAVAKPLRVDRQRLAGEHRQRFLGHPVGRDRQQRSAGAGFSTWAEINEELRRGRRKHFPPS